MPMMTYDQAAELLGIAPDSVRRMARKKKWGRAVGNDGKGMVEVPDEYLAARPARREDDPPEPRPDDREDARALIARLEGELGGQRELVAAERRRADELAERMTKIEADRDARIAAITAERDQWITRATRPWWRRLAG